MGIDWDDRMPQPDPDYEDPGIPERRPKTPSALRVIWHRIRRTSCGEADKG